MLSDEQRQAIRERVNKATQGPWSADGIGSEGYDIQFSMPGANMKDRWNALGFSGRIAEVRSGVDWQCIRNNAEFIAHAREDVPKLLNEVERLHVALEELLAKCPTCDGCGYVDGRPYAKRCPTCNDARQALGQEADPIDPRD